MRETRKGDGYSLVCSTVSKVGRLKHYLSKTCGQFRPGDTANPNIGSVDTLEDVQEARVETLCVGEEVARKAVEALKM